jgi:hypothetical protein
VYVVSRAASTSRKVLLSKSLRPLSHQKHFTSSPVESTWARNDWEAEVHIFDYLSGRTQTEVKHV